MLHFCCSCRGAVEPVDIPENVAGFWTLDRTTITGRNAVILRQHTTPFRPMIVPFDDLELVYQSLRTLEPPHTHKFPRVNAQDCKLGPIQPWDVKDFLRPGRGRAVAPGQGTTARVVLMGVLRASHSPYVDVVGNAHPGIERPEAAE